MGVLLYYDSAGNHAEQIALLSEIIDQKTIRDPAKRQKGTDKRSSLGFIAFTTIVKSRVGRLRRHKKIWAITK